MNITQAGAAARTGYIPPQRGDAGQQAEAESFLDAVARMNQSRTGTLEHSGSGVSPDPVSVYQSMSLYGAGRIASSESVSETGAVSLEEMLKAKYPNLTYHVFDASSSYWRTRNDYPHYLLYQEGNEAKETLENWQPTGANPFYGSIDGRFIAPKEIHALGSVPPGSKAVVIHPKVQERMEQDPAYAQEIYARIDAWFAFDVARNEAIMPGCTWDMSQAVAIGEDGKICNACASSSGGGITCSKSGKDDDGYDWWDERMARHKMFMQLWLEGRITDLWLFSGQTSMAPSGSTANEATQLSSLASSPAAQAARQHLAEMMEGDTLKNILGDTVAGTPIDVVFERSWESIAETQSLMNAMAMM